MAEDDAVIVAWLVVVVNPCMSLPSNTDDIMRNELVTWKNMQWIYSVKKCGNDVELPGVMIS